MWLQQTGLVSSESSVVNLAFKLQAERIQFLKGNPDLKHEHGVMLDEFARVQSEQPVSLFLPPMTDARMTDHPARMCWTTLK